jgi:hypothetical protein
MDARTDGIDRAQRMRWISPSYSTLPPSGAANAARRFSTYSRIFRSGREARPSPIVVSGNRVRRGPNDIFIPYGRDGDVPIPGDYDGDGIADFAVFRPQSASWFVDTNQNGGTDIRVFYGQGSDVPRSRSRRPRARRRTPGSTVPGDFDGDGITDFAVFRPASGKWFVDTNRNGGTDLSVVFGRSGDVPPPRRRLDPHRGSVRAVTRGNGVRQLFAPPTIRKPRPRSEKLSDPFPPRV